MWDQFMDQFPQMWEQKGSERFWRVRFRIIGENVLISPLSGVQINKDVVALAEREALKIVQQSDPKDAK